MIRDEDCALIGYCGIGERLCSDWLHWIVGEVWALFGYIEIGAQTLRL